MQIDYSKLAKIEEQHGDSFYLCDTQKFSNNYDELLQAFRNFYPETEIAYSYKTNYIPRLCSIIKEKGGYAEVVSDMEYELAIRIGVIPSRIIVNGPYKTKKSLEKYFLSGSIVNLDSLNEVNMAIEIAYENQDRIISTGIRCNFNIRENFTSRFGISVDGQDLKTAINKLNQSKNIRINGIHCHFPDRDFNSFKIRVDEILRLLETDFTGNLDYIDIGGGFFGKMPDELKTQFSVQIPNYENYAHEVASRINEFFINNEINRPILIIEPGTAIVADVLSFVAKVIEIKTIGSTKIAMTTGSKFNLGSFSSSINMPLEVYSQINNSNSETIHHLIDISGYTCIEADYLYRGYSGVLNIGDFLVFNNVGSYSIVFKPPFILPNVPILEIDFKKENLPVLKRKEELEDLFRTFSF